MSIRYKRTNWVRRRLEAYSSGCSSGFGLGQFAWREFLAHGLIAIFLFPTSLMAEQLASPTLSSPSAGSVLNYGQPIEFQWDKVDSANTYRLQVARSSDFQVSSNGKDCPNCVLNEKVNKDNKFSSSLDSGNYFWRVRAGNLDSATKLEASEWTKPQSFSVKSNTDELTAPVLYKLQRTTIGQEQNRPVSWKVKDVQSDTEITLCINNLKTGEITVEPTSVKKVKDVYEVTHDFSKEGYGEAIYAVAAVSKGSDCSLESFRNQSIVQIVAPSTDETTPNFTPCITATVSKKGADGKEVTVPGKTYDVIVIDGTSAGIAAAYTAAKEGLKTCLLESTSLLGGMLTNGIGHTDISFYQFIKSDRDRRYLSYGLMDELRKKVEQILKNSDDANKKFLEEKTKLRFGNAISGLDYSPSVIRQAVYDLLDEQNLSITLDAPFLSVDKKTEKTEKEESEYYIVDTTKGRYKGKYLVDATDSGDVAVALSKKLGKFKTDKMDYCKSLNEREFDKKFTPVKEWQLTQDNVPTTIPVDKIPTFCLRNPTQAYSFVMTLQQYESKNKNWSYMETPPPNCFGNRQGIEGEYTDDFFTDDNNHWSVSSGLMGRNPVMFQVKHHTTIDTYKPENYLLEAYKKTSYSCTLTVEEKKKLDNDKLKDKLKDCKVFCLVEKKENPYKKLGDELIDCNTHDVEGLPTGYADKANDIERLPIVDRYLNHTMCFLYNMQHHPSDEPTIIKSDWIRGSDKKSISIIASQIGLTSNEDPLRGNFPARMYVREGRRINGLQTFTGKDAQNAYYNQQETLKKPNGLDYLENHNFNKKGRPSTGELFGKHYTEELKLERPVEKLKRSIAITTYGMDSHSVYLDERGDGKIPPYHMNFITGPGAIPFGVMVPRSLAKENILVPLAASAGTWGQSVMRMEPTRLSMGQAAAVAIKMIANKDKWKNFQEFTEDEHAIFDLQERLISEYGEKIYLYLDDSFYSGGTHTNENHMIAQFLGVWGIASGKNLSESKRYLFDPWDQITRAEISKMIVKTRTDLLGKTFVKKQERDVSTLTDVSEEKQGDLYQPIKTLYEAGIVQGYSDNSFAPNQDVTRGELSKFVVKGILGVGDESFECKTKETLNGQLKCVERWITPYLNCAIKNGLLDKSDETAKATRMDAAKAVYEAYLRRRKDNFDAKTVCSK